LIARVIASGSERDSGSDDRARGIDEALSAVLMSPEFFLELNRIQPTSHPTPFIPLAICPASRLSFSSGQHSSDRTKLLDTAIRGDLHKPRRWNYRFENAADSRSENLVNNFANNGFICAIWNQSRRTSVYFPI